MRCVLDLISHLGDLIAERISLGKILILLRFGALIDKIHDLRRNSAVLVEDLDVESFRKASEEYWKEMFGTEWKNISSTHMKIEYDDGEMEGDFSFGSISNSTSISGIFRLNKDEVKLNDGYFEVLLVRKARVSEAPSLFNKIRKKEYDGKRIILLKTSKVKITADAPIAWTLDGEYGGEHQTVMVHVLSKAIDICSPADNVLFERPQETSAPTQP